MTFSCFDNVHSRGRFILQDVSYFLLLKAAEFSEGTLGILYLGTSLCVNWVGELYLLCWDCPQFVPPGALAESEAEKLSPGCPIAPHLILYFHLLLVEEDI